MGVKKIKKDDMRLIHSGIFGIITTLILVFALLSVAFITGDAGILGIYLFLTFLSLAASRLFLAINFRYLADEKKMFPFIRNLVFSGLFLVASILCWVIKDFKILTLILAFVYIGCIIASRVCLIIEKHTIGSIVGNGLLIIVGALLIFTFLSLVFEKDPNLDGGALLVLMLIIIIISMFEVLGFAFSKIQLKGLIKIIRKTYVIEILFGMVILFISCSFYFSVMEDDMTSFGDGLWYSFAVITTIGFGDITAKTIIGRFLTVILGLYGIIVTASITSVIVNYYNEVKAGDINTDEEPAKIEQKEEEKKETPAIENKEEENPSSEDKPE